MHVDYSCIIIMKPGGGEIILQVIYGYTAAWHVERPTFWSFTTDVLSHEDT